MGRHHPEVKNVPCKIVSDQQKENTLDLLLGVQMPCRELHPDPDTQNTQLAAPQKLDVTPSPEL